MRRAPLWTRARYRLAEPVRILRANSREGVTPVSPLLPITEPSCAPEPLAPGLVVLVVPDALRPAAVLAARGLRADGHLVQVTAPDSSADAELRAAGAIAVLWGEGDPGAGQLLEHVRAHMGAGAHVTSEELPPDFGGQVAGALRAGRRAALAVLPISVGPCR